MGVKDDFLAVRGVPKDLRHRFKVACVKTDKTIREVICMLMEAFVKRVEGGEK